MFPVRVLVAVLAAAALVAPTAQAQSTDWHASGAAVARQDLRSPDARDAATEHQATTPAVQGPPTWPTDPQPISSPATTSDHGDSGIDAPTLGLGILGSLVAVLAVAGIAERSRRRKDRHATA